MNNTPVYKLPALVVILFSLFSWIAAEPAVEKLPLQKEADALIQTWTQAQNRGDFALYSSLYHESFNGVKRSGPKEFRFRHRDWLEDRRKMFRGQFTVTVENLQLTETGGAWTAGFVQTWESGAYKDRGAKIIVLKPVAGRLMIVREEMLNSTVMAPSRNITDLSNNGKLLFVVEEKYIVFSSGYAAELGRGAPEHAGAAAPAVSRSVRKSIDSALVAKRYLDLAGEEFLVYDRKGDSFRTRISRLWLFTTYIPHFGETAYFEAEGVSASQMLTKAWETGSSYKGNIYLVGELRESTRDGVWARVAKNPPPVFYEMVRTDPLFPNVEAKSLEKLDDPSALAERDVSKETVAYRHPKTGTVYYFFTLTGGNPCGGDYFYDLAAVYEKQGRSFSKLETFNCPAWKPASVFDVDGDGSPEMFFDGGFGVIFQVESRTLGGNLSVPFLDCGC